MRPIPALVTILSLLWTAPAAAQRPLDTDTTLVDREFTDNVESVRIALFKKTVYRVELGGAHARPRLQPVRSGVYPPAVLRVLDAGPIGGPVYEVHVDRDGEYEVGIGGSVIGTPVRLRLTTDAGTTASRQLKKDTPSWSLGFRAEAGRHSGYLTSATPDSPDGGMVYDGCLAISNGTWLSLCLGAGSDARGANGTRVAWIFGEVHARLFALNAAGRLPTNFGVLMRIAQGGAGSAVSRDPSFYGAGGFIQQWFRRSPNGRGLSLILSAQYGVIRNITIKGESTTLFKGGLQWLP
jgi:hypothetical protein